MDEELGGRFRRPSLLPPLNGLRAFEAVARHKSFTLAADDLYVSQSAVSHQVRNLEKFLETPLIERDGQGFLLTKEGEILSRELQKAFQQIKSVVADIQAMVNVGPLGISTTSYFATKWLAPRLPNFWKLLPPYTLRFYHADDLSDFTDSRIHIAIRLLHKQSVSEDAELLMEGNLTPVCSPSLIESEQSDLSPEALVRYSLLHGDDRSAWKEWLHAAGVPDLQPKYYEYYEDANVRQKASMQGEGLDLVCPALAADDLVSGSLVCPFATRLTSYAYYLVVPDGRIENVNVRHLVDWLRDQATTD